MRSILLATLIAAIPACTTDITGEPAGTGVTGDPGGGSTGGGGDTGAGGGGDNGGGTGSADTGKVAVSVDQTTVNTELGKTVALTYTVTSMNGYTGMVTVTPTITNTSQAVVTGWTLAPTPATVTLAADGSSQVKMNVMVPTDDAELAPIIQLGVSDGTSAATVSSNFTIKNQLTVTLDAAGSANGTHTTWPAKNAPIKIKSGATIIFHNADNVPHRIHASGGIAHEPSDMPGGGDYNVGPVTQSATWYCHDHENAQNDTRLVNVE